MSEYKKDGKKCFVSNDMDFLKNDWNIASVLSSIYYYEKDGETIKISKYLENTIQSNWEEPTSYVDYYKHNKRILIGHDYEWVPDETDPLTMLNTGLFLGAGGSESLKNYDNTSATYTYTRDLQNNCLTLTETNNIPPGLPDHLPWSTSDFWTDIPPKCYFIVLLGGGGGGSGGNWNTCGGGGGSGAIWIGVIRLKDESSFSIKVEKGGSGGWVGNGSSGGNLTLYCGGEELHVGGGGGGIYNGAGGSAGTIKYYATSSSAAKSFDGDGGEGGGPSMNHFYTLYWHNGYKGGTHDGGGGAGGDNTLTKHSLHSRISASSYDSKYNLAYKYTTKQVSGSSGQPNRGGGGGAGGNYVQLNWHEGGGGLQIGAGGPGNGGAGTWGGERNGTSATGPSHGGGGAGIGGWGSAGTGGGAGGASLFCVCGFGSAGQE